MRKQRSAAGYVLQLICPKNAASRVCTGPKNNQKVWRVRIRTWYKYFSTLLPIEVVQASKEVKFVVDKHI